MTADWKSAGTIIVNIGKEAASYRNGDTTRAIKGFGVEIIEK